MKDTESENYVSGLETIENILILFELHDYRKLYNVLLNFYFINVDIDNIIKELIPLIEIRYIFETEKQNLKKNKLNNSNYIIKLNNELKKYKKNSSLEILISYLNFYSNNICLGFPSKEKKNNFVNSNGCSCNISIPHNLLPPIEHTLEGQQIIFGNDTISTDELKCCSLSILNPFYEDKFYNNYLAIHLY